MWPTLTIVLLVALIAVHLWWRRRLAHFERAAGEEAARQKTLQAQAQAQAQSQQEALLNSVAGGLLVLDRTGRIRFANRAFAELFGVCSEMHGRTVLEAVRAYELGELLDRVYNDGRAAVPEPSECGTGRFFETEFHSPGPPARWFQVNAAGIVEADGQIQGAVMVFHDVTRLRQFERAREEFVANVSHELRTPLSHIKGYVETLLAGAKDDPEHMRKFLGAIERNITRLELLIQDLLAISELESAQVKLNLQPVPLRQFAEEIFLSFQERAAVRKTKLVNVLPELRVLADPDRLRQVWANLLDNAIKYGHESGTVTARARLGQDGMVEVAVQDDGPGIPAEALERVFERFYRADKARSRAQGGTGLGLAIVKHIIQAHGGKVWAKSELGKGATFFFTLPQA